MNKVECIAIWGVGYSHENGMRGQANPGDRFELPRKNAEELEKIGALTIVRVIPGDVSASAASETEAEREPTAEAKKRTRRVSIKEEPAGGDES